MALPGIVRVFRPRTFFHFISLLTATEFITITLLINKVEGVYGILALFTGYHLSALQLSMYIYSIAVLVLVCYLGPHIRQQSPLENLILAWVYLLDSLVNASYTALFGLGWFITLAQHLNPTPPTDGDSPKVTAPGGKTIGDTAGFTDPSAGPVDSVDIIASPSSDKLVPGQEAKVIPHGDGTGLGNTIFQSGSIMSITIISTLWFIRLYFILIIMAYARQVLRGYSQSASVAASRKPVSAEETDSTEHLAAGTDKLANPFHPSAPLGQGWKGKLGRALTRFPATYWLGRDEADEEWVRGADERFRRRLASRGTFLKSPPAPNRGTDERVRRARSGTGPPPPGLELLGRRSGESAVGEGRASGEL
ncbi:Inositol phoshorylceramide synthase regulatory subunit kei1 [Sphaceloma murrayae]|uniref:Inositol phoshorylceramide synthase regulatory subunit kei1 n=1 Tax=Sphaceloma murrayae TaxID=2082308 RepID=A0A2K1QTK0_9PEZI|nr:Inositol phoshorylceramide synthase regulatory subunit kei1 [Sphaceloma murrayae]